MDSLREMLEALPGAAATAYGEIDGGSGDCEDQVRLEGLVEAVLARFAELPVLLLEPDDNALVVVTSEALRALAWCAWNEYNLGGRARCEALQPLLTGVLPLLRAGARAVAASVRAASLSALAEIPWPGSEEVEVVRRGLADPEGPVRAAAVLAACRRLGPEAEHLVAPLVADEHRDVEKRVIKGLLALESRAVIPALFRRARAAARHPLWITIQQLQSLGVPESRPLLLDILSRSRDDTERRQAAEALVEHVDASCMPTLFGALERGDHAAIFAAMGLARLGPQVAGDGLLAWVERRSEHLRRWNEGVVDLLSMTSIYAVAAAGRRDDAPAILAAIPGFSQRRPYEIHSLSAVAVLEHPAALAPILAAHEAGTSWERRLTALALGLQGDRRALGSLREGLREVSADATARVNTVLAIALLDPEAVDAGLVAAAASPWTHRIATFEEEALARGFAVRALGRRLRARGVPPTGALADLTRIVVVELEAARSAEATALRCYRGRGGSSGICHSWVFLIADLHAEARLALRGSTEMPTD